MRKVILELTKIQLINTYMPIINMFNNKKKNGEAVQTASTSKSLNGKQACAIALFTFIFFNVFIMMSVWAFIFANAVKENGAPWIFMASAYIASFTFSVIGSVFVSKSYMFDAKDNELLLSMPIKPSSILFSRLVTLFTLDTIYGLMILIPCGIAYGVTFGYSIVGVILFILSIILLPLFATSICAILGYFIGFISSKIGKSPIINTVLSIVAFSLYMLCVMNMDNILKFFENNVMKIGDVIKTYAPPAYWYGASITDSNILYIVCTLLIFVVPAILIFMFISNKFRNVLSNKAHVKMKKYVQKPMKKTNIRWTLIKKELAYIVRTPSYIFNGAGGSVIALFLSGLLIFSGGELVQDVNKSTNLSLNIISAIIMAGCIMVTTMNVVTGASISVEKNTLWILKSQPISYWSVVISKSLTAPVLSIPATVILPIVASIVFGVPIVNTVLIVFICIIASIFLGFFGVAVNLKIPNFNWVNEILVIKQSASVGISLFLGMFIVGIPSSASLVLIYVGLDVVVGLLATLILLLGFSAILYVILRTAGRKSWNEM